MKRWVLITLVLYFLCLSILVIPLLLFTIEEGGTSLLPGFYIWVVPVLILAQAVLLLIPTAVVKERPVKKREVILSALFGAIPMGILMA